jgi:hypothetical protein
VRALSVSTTIRTPGRRAATMRAEKPLLVNTTMVEAPSNRTAVTEAAAMVSSVVALPGATRSSPCPRGTGACSAAAAMRRMASTASTGCRPAAVSAESITASVPSRMALATSLASARVGRGCCTIDSSICVAVITGRP